MTTAIYHIETGLVLSLGNIVPNDNFSTIDLDDSLLPFTTDSFLMVDTESHQVFNINENTQKENFDIETNITQLKNTLKQLDIDLVANINNEDFKANRSAIRAEINQLELLREAENIKNIIKPNKYKLIKYIEEAVLFEEIALIMLRFKDLVALSAI